MELKSTNRDLRKKLASLEQEVSDLKANAGHNQVLLLPKVDWRAINSNVMGDTSLKAKILDFENLSRSLERHTRT